jgi:hypothetical protein
MVNVGVTLINFGMRMLGNCPMGNPESKCENKLDHTETAYYGDELVVVATKQSHFPKKFVAQLTLLS